MRAISSCGSTLPPSFSWVPFLNQDTSCSLSQYPWKVPGVSFRVQRQSALDTVAWLGADWPWSLKCFSVLRHQESDPAERDLVVFLVGNHAEMSLSGECQKWCKDKGGSAVPAGGGSWCVTWRGNMELQPVQVVLCGFPHPDEICTELHAVWWETSLSAWGISFERFDA